MIKRNRTKQNINRRDRHNGIVLMITLIVLAALSSIVYTVSIKVAEYKKRQEYMVAYQNARYACDSAMKYALSTIEELELDLADRADAPDFSDIFTMNDEEYQFMLEEWAYEISQKIAEEEQEGEYATADKYSQYIKERQPAGSSQTSGLLDIFGFGGEGETAPGDQGFGSQDYIGGMDFDSGFTDSATGSDMNSLENGEYYEEPSTFEDEYYIDPNEVIVPGPYGPPWPYVAEPMKIDIEGTEVVIEIIDENAKMPLVWAIMKDKEVEREAEAAVEIFCRWMQMEDYQITELLEQMQDIKKIKEFDKDARDIVKRVKVEDTKKEDDKKDNRRSRTSRRSRRSRRTRTKYKTEKRSVTANKTDFARLMHSSLLDRASLSLAVPDTGERLESPIRYLGLWGSQKVNINTAPRHVLEAAFMFGGQSAKIAHEIIQLRKEKPFESMEDLRERLFGYSDSIEKAEPYITTKSDYLSIRVTAVRSNAVVTSVATVIKNGRKVEKLAIMNL